MVFHSGSCSEESVRGDDHGITRCHLHKKTMPVKMSSSNDLVEVICRYLRAAGHECEWQQRLALRVEPAGTQCCKCTAGSMMERFET